MLNNCKSLERRRTIRESVSLRGFAVPAEYSVAFNRFKSSSKPAYPSEVIGFVEKRQKTIFFRAFALITLIMAFIGTFYARDMTVTLCFILFVAALGLFAAAIVEGCNLDDKRKAKKIFNRWLISLDCFFGNDYFFHVNTNENETVRVANNRESNCRPDTLHRTPLDAAKSTGQTMGFTDRVRTVNSMHDVLEPDYNKQIGGAGNLYEAFNNPCNRERHERKNERSNQSYPPVADTRVNNTIEQLRYLIAKGINENTAKEVIFLLSDPSIQKRTPEQQRKINDALGQILQLIADKKEEKILS
jgi:hypothetical protein